MIRKIISVLLCVAILLTLSFNISAEEQSQTKNIPINRNNNTRNNYSKGSKYRVKENK